MKDHPIEGLMATAMNSIQDMIDVNTIIGEPIETSNNVIIIPISKVSFGFVAGGSEFNRETVNECLKNEKDEKIDYRLPFGGGSGAGVTLNPIAFLIVQPDNVKLLPVNHTSSIDKLLDYVPDVIEKVNNLMNKCIKNKNSTCDKENQEEINTNNNNSNIKEEKEEKIEYETEYNEFLEDE